MVILLIQEPMRATGIHTWGIAMAMGKVVIVTGTDGPSDYFEHGISGFYVDYGDAAALRHYIDLVMKDQELRRRVAEAARERAWKEFSPEVFRLRVLSLLKGE